VISDLRIGALGAATITPMALLRPSRKANGVSVTAVAARDRSRAEKFARKHAIEKVHAGYDALLADPDVDAIYNPLPNALHAEWTLRALDAGKHVLCEKPFASNAAEAQKVHEAAEANDRIVMEAFHYRYHPLAAPGSKRGSPRSRRTSINSRHFETRWWTESPSSRRPAKRSRL
jgi:predicted dehydrogenase